MIVDRWLLLLVGWAVASTLLWGLYVLQRRSGDATAVDAGWATSLVLLAALYGILGPGELCHKVLIATLVGLENLRVALLVLRRIRGTEDTRYQELRTRWRARGREQLSFAVFYQAQAALAALLSVPILLAVFNGHSHLEPLEWTGTAVWIVGAGFEAIADRQLSRHKAAPANRGRTMRLGLWRYSRHPNYFGQWLTWIGYALVASAAPWGWVAWFAPALMLYLILFVTGVKPSEEAAAKNRGEDFRRYQRETSAFVPWFPRGKGGDS